MNDQDSALLTLATQVADGTPVDWESASASDPDLKGGIEGLRWIEAVAISRRLAGRRLGDQGAAQQDAVEHEPTMPLPALKVLAPPKTAESTAAPEPPRLDEVPPLGPGSMWGRFKIIEKIGEGGGGEVFRTHDSRLGRDVALKLWKENAVYKTTGTEARRLARVQHPAILPLHGTGRFHGYAGMWTDFVRGKNLEEILDADGLFEVGEACRIGIALCDALQAMHSKGLVHRDVKTTNVMRDHKGRVILMDFGSVKELPRGLPAHTIRKRGTPLAMAPEVVRGGRVGRPADIYGVGVLLYRLVSGCYPIEAKTMPELVDAHARKADVPLRKRRPELPSGFVEIVQRCLASQPSGRQRDIEALRQDLVRFARPQPGFGWSGVVQRLLGGLKRRPT